MANISETGNHIPPLEGSFNMDYSSPNGSPAHIPFAFADHIAGGLRTVNTWNDMINIPEAFLQVGMLVYVASGASAGHYYKLCFVDGKLNAAAEGAWKLAF